MSHVTVVRGSEYQSFLNCRKQWYYQWFVGLEAKKPDGKLFFGTLFHKWLENYYKNSCDELQADLDTSVWFNDQDMSAMEQTDIDEMKALFKGVRNHYLKTYDNTDNQFKVLGTEIEFVVKLEEDLYMTGTIDLVYETPEGKVRFMDHKTVASIQMYVEKSVMDRQISRYWWALKMISAGIGRVKQTIDGKEMWVRWEDLIGKEIDGFDYNLIAKDFPKEPKILKSGKLSTDKSQKTTYDLYMKELIKLNLPVEEYTDMLEFLKGKPNQWLTRVDVKRIDKELEDAAWEFSYVAGDIHDVSLMLKEAPQNTNALTYRNITHNCMNMCQFKNLCQTAIEGGNVNMVMNLGYKKKEEK